MRSRREWTMANDIIDFEEYTGDKESGLDV
jgi:hypothetical protein